MPSGLCASELAAGVCILFCCWTAGDLSAASYLPNTPKGNAQGATGQRPNFKLKLYSRGLKAFLHKYAFVQKVKVMRQIRGCACVYKYKICRARVQKGKRCAIVILILHPQT